MIENVEQLDDVLSTPTERVVETMKRLDGDVMFLGVGGKMGPTMARMAKRASEQAGVARRVWGVSRFGNRETKAKLDRWGIETICCDLLDGEQVRQLPDSANVVIMTGMKFGTAAQAELTWASNCYMPAVICDRFRTSRLVAFSTGNVYGMVPVASGGSLITDRLRPVGEYSMSALGRERIYEHFSRRWQIPIALLRLNYATELRYGVLVDLALQVKSGRPVDISMGHVNVIWLADANAMSLAAFDHVSTPLTRINLAGAEILNLRSVCEQFAESMDLTVEFAGQERSDAYLNNGQDGYQRLGHPLTEASQMIHWTSDWVRHDRPLLGKPTHFQQRSGDF